MTSHELYRRVIDMYGTRMFWISDLARNLGISYADAQYITSFLGFYRGRLSGSPTDFVKFTNDTEIRRILRNVGGSCQTCTM